MISFEKFELKNGLKFIVNTDTSTPFVAINTIYNVGSKDESPDQTGFAHLFEHLMFGGSKNIPSFDTPLQNVGGDNNAFTNTDITNYYITLPKDNIETAFWLESDRMLELAFSIKSLNVQKNVVIEEFKQRYINRPYGDTWLLLRPLAYKTHPYQWSTIGKELSHIENAKLQDVKNFFFSHYAPNNAVIAISGNITTKKVKKLAEKWYGNIPAREIKVRNLPQEEVQTERRFLEVERDVPSSAIYKAFHMCDRNSPDYHAADLLSDLLSNGKSSRLYTNLVQDKKIFSELNAYISGENDPGLFIISGNVMPDFNLNQANESIDTEIAKMVQGFTFEYELQKVKNKVESTLIFSESNILNKAMNLAKFELLDDAELINTEIKKYTSVEPNDINRVANNILRKENESTLFYKSKVKE